jgi:integrase
VARLRVRDIDSARMTITIHQGKGQRDRVVMLSPVLLDTLRQYWRYEKPKEWLFPGRNPDQPISGNDIFIVFHNAVRHAGVRYGSTHHPDSVGAPQPEDNLALTAASLNTTLSSVLRPVFEHTRQPLG